MTKYAITGSTGLVGTCITGELARRGEKITRVIRSAANKTGLENTIEWDIWNQRINFAEWEDFDVVIHLAGGNISAHRWTKNYKKCIYDSRIESTKFLSESLLQLERPPRLVITASAMGYYGLRRPEETLTEDSSSAEGFLAKVCRDWEAAADPLKKAGIRVVHLRFGVILSQMGGALAKILPVFKTGLGGPIGSGRQIMSWVSIQEIPDIIEHLLKHQDIRGPVNVVSPHPVSNLEFTKTLALVLRRPAFLTVPPFVLRLLLGDMADELLIHGARVIPDRLRSSGYRFRHAHLKPALMELLN